MYYDPLFLYHQWQANLRILDVDEIKTVPYTPLSHPFVERLIGTIRREYLDHTLFWNACDLERKLEEFRQYYNAHRVHTSLDGARMQFAAGPLALRTPALLNCLAPSGDYRPRASPFHGRQRKPHRVQRSRMCVRYDLKCALDLNTSIAK